MLFQQAAERTPPCDQPARGPTLSCPANPRVYTIPLIYCTVSAELHAHDNLLSHSFIKCLHCCKEDTIFHYTSPLVGCLALILRADFVALILLQPALLWALPKAHSDKDLPKEREDKTPRLWKLLAHLVGSATFLIWQTIFTHHE